MNIIAAIFVGAIVAYLVNAFLGEGTTKRIISIIIGFIVMLFVKSIWRKKDNNLTIKYWIQKLI